ncbi:hypothetical protein PMAYCL1PPCAC_16829 [Pristionchus mayeri]|uniref:Delta(3,5)-Delta(2,4)-dienoyl-CoA isomerase, mitochondrial n=1 Tax=Pristionchus mayeri TaxID=1317129 RepID=A0AAN5HZN8_9BILA|nr:hypothetical protein PMAYCL1PPCAC_16829 [Pristionchus mayeri]
MRPDMAYSYKFLLVKEIGDGVFNVQLNRPEKRNAINLEIWDEIGDVFSKLDTDCNCRAVILSGNGKAFSSGIEVQSLAEGLTTFEEDDVARKGRQILRFANRMERSFTMIEKCCKPVIAAMHTYCLGIAMDISTACTIRYCTKDTEFSVKEVALGLASDMGVLNRLPKIVGNHSWIYEAALTGRHFRANEALQQGLVSRVFDSYDDLMAAAKETAKVIATNSPVAVQGVKIVLNYARDHPVDDSLRYVALWNMSQGQTNDIAESAVALMTKGPKPIYAKL